MEAAVFQLLFHIQDAQTVGDGGIHLHGLPGFIPALLLGPGVAGAHIMQPVAELDDHDPDIPAHGQQHLAQVLGLQLLDVGELNFRQLGDAVHQQGHFLAERGFDLLDGGGGILHHVVQQGSGNTFGVHAQVQHQPGHSQRVADIGLAAAAADALVGVVGHVVGLIDHLHVVSLAAGLDGLHKLFIGHDLRPHFRGQSALRRIGRQGRGGHGGRLRCHHRLVQVGLGRVGILPGRPRFYFFVRHFTLPPNISGWAHRPGFSSQPWAQAPRTLPRRVLPRQSGPPVPAP